MYKNNDNICEVQGTSKNVSDAVKEKEQTIREQIRADKEIKMEEWKVNMLKANAETEAHHAKMQQEIQVNLASIRARNDVDLKATSSGLTSDQNFNIQKEKLVNAAKDKHDNAVMKQQKVGVDHEENMKKIGVTGEIKLKEIDSDLQVKLAEISGKYGNQLTAINGEYGYRNNQLQSEHNQEMKALHYRGDVTMKALELSNGRNFKLNAQALDFGNRRSRNHSRNSFGATGRNQAFALTGPGTALDSDDDGEIFDDSTLLDMTMGVEEMKLENEMKKNQLKYKRDVEMERLKLEQKKMELEMERLRSGSQAMSPHGSGADEDDHELEMERLRIEQTRKELELEKLARRADQN